MTISTTSSSAIFLGNDVTNPFTFGFVCDSASTFSAIYTNASGVSTLLSPSQYTLTLNAPAVGSLHSVGGTILYPKTGSPLATGTSLTVTRTVPLAQLTSISNQGDFAPTVIEQAMDTLCLEIQQISARTGANRGTWISGAVYNFGDIVQDGANGTNTGNYYTCVIANTSGTWATDLAAGDWVLSFDLQQANTDATSAAASAATATAQAVIATAQAVIATSQATISTAEAVIATTQATTATGAASTATTQAGIATTAAATAAAYSTALTATSATSLTIGLGAKTFTTQASKGFVANQFFSAISSANNANYMHGTITSYSGTSLVVNVTDIGGSGAHTDWTLSVSGSQGPIGTSTPITVNPETTNTSISAGQSGQIFTNEGSSGTVTYTLPVASAGLDFTISSVAAHIIAVTANTGATIRNGGSVSSSAGTFTSDGTTGPVIRVTAMNSTQWIATHITGQWTVT